ncbi:class I SAM-dependent methyltransferase [Bacillus sp. FJAT-49732]|uniref:Class I SAM-dependent methyltransferase n=1 Tax=Lederbergia citrisecunda TaxID=2833583 RepID=A0A942TS33_9BACI|nr:class I SAM-dependent methyltransferase [Lederbergia citrisecunda]MBS4200804.1 class I SAM-dependent methyltransferase [Lederbergia citrisecunda]
MNRIDYIRKEEKEYHDYCYDNYKLFEEGSWLHKPVMTVMEMIPLLEEKNNLNILDLGSEVGRNSIPIAQLLKEKGGKIVCVDLLESALQKLKQYSEEHDVDEMIQSEQADIGTFSITPNNYDFIVAVSSLEHVDSESVFEKVIHQMVEGTKDKGINCIIVNSEVEEIDLDTNESLFPLMEINLSTEEMMNKLNEAYKGWEVIKVLVKPLKYTIKRKQRPVLLKTNAITFAVKKVK